MSLSALAFTSGVSSLMIVIIGWALGLYLFKRFLSSPDNNTLALAVIMVGVGSVWLAIAINFVLNLLGMNYLDPLPYILILGWIPGVIVVAIGYVFISIVKEEYLKPAMIIFGLFFVINTLIIYVFIPFNQFGFKIDDAIVFTNAANELPDASTIGFFRILSLVSIVIMLATSIFFIITSIRTDIPLVKTRAGLLGLGLLIVSILITFDSIINTDSIYVLVFVRLAIVIGLFILVMGITLPKRIFKNLT